MNTKSLVEAYINACNVYEDIQEDYNEPGFLKRLRAQEEVLQSCVQHLREAADSPDPAVWHTLGNACTAGRGTKRDHVEAIQWFQRAADTAYPPAMVNLGLRLRHRNQASDQVAAIELFRKAAEKGYASGMVWLGFSYREGTGVPCDHGEAVRWFTKAVEAGDGHSMIHVGRMYRNMSLPNQAIPWFLRAAEAEFSESFIELASIYDDRESEVYNPAEAHKWYRVVAEHSEGTASRALLAIARQHMDGVGVPCDVEMAKLWLRRLLHAVPEKSSAYREATKLLKKIEGLLL